MLLPNLGNEQHKTNKYIFRKGTTFLYKPQQPADDQGHIKHFTKSSIILVYKVRPHQTSREHQQKKN